MPTSDEKLVIAAKGGCRESFRALYERYYTRVYWYVVGLVRDIKTGQVRENAEDVTQDCFVAARQQLHTLGDASRFRSWLFVIAHNKAQTVSTRPSLAPLPDGHDVASNSDAPDQSLNQEERDMALMAAIADLPELYREAVLDQLEQFRSGDRRERDSTERSRLSRAHRQIRERLGPVFLA